MEKNQNNRPMTVLSVDAVGRGACLAHLETFFAKDAKKVYRPAEGDKKATLSFRVTSNTNTWELLGRAEGDANRYADKQESHILFCSARGDLAERLKDVDMTGKVCLTGKISRFAFTTSDGSESEAVGLSVYGLVSMKDAESAKTAPTFVPAMKVNGRNGEQTMACLVSGTIAWIDEVKQGTYGPYLRFSIAAKGNIARAYAVANGEQTSDESHSVSVTISGTRAERMAKFLRKGMDMVVSGPLTKKESGDQTYYNMSGWAISLYPKRKDGTEPAATSNPAPAAASAAAPVDAAPVANSGFTELLDEDDGELPF